LAYIVGLMLGDGGVYGNSYTVFCRDREKEFVHWCAEKVEDVFKVQPNIHRVAPNCWAASTNRRDVHKRLCEIGFPKGRKLTTAEIPAIFLKMEGDRIDVVKGLFDAEGYCGIDRQRHGNRVYEYAYVGIDMIAKPVIREAQKILRELGIEGKVQMKKPRAWGRNPQWSIIIKGNDRVRKFAAKIGFRHPVKSAKLREIIGGGSSETIR
jgi:intein/homing endonuclease